MAQEILNEQTATNIGGYLCFDLGTKEVYTAEGNGYERTLLCFWNERQAVVKYLRSPPALDNNGNVIPGLVVGGQPYPDDPSCYVNDINVVGEGPIGINTAQTMIVYKYARLTVNYRSGINPIETGSISIEPSVDIITVPKSTSWLYYRADGAALTDSEKESLKIPIHESPPFAVPVIHVCRTFNRIPTYPHNKFMTAYQAPVNSLALNIEPGSFKIPNMGSSLEDFLKNNTTGITGSPSYDIDTVMFTGARISKQYGIGTNVYWNAEVFFKIRPYLGWNSVIKRDGSTAPVCRANGQPLIPRSDLNLLFTY